jgi:hypothetical protein
MDTLENIELITFAKANILVFQELKTGVASLKEFNSYLDSLNTMTDGSLALSNSFKDLLGRTNNFEQLANKLDERIEESNALMQFLKSHFSELEQNSDYVKEAVIKSKDVMAHSLEELKEYMLKKMASLKEITIKEEDLMVKSLGQNRGHLSKLDLLTELNNALQKIEGRSNDQNQEFLELLKSIKGSIDNGNSTLVGISKRKTLKDRKASVVRYFKR